MNVLYDHQVFEFQNIGGISRYFAELLKQNPMAQLSLKYSDNVYLQEEYFASYEILPKKHASNSFLPGLNFKGKGKLAKCYTRLFKKNNISESIKKIKNLNYNVFHPTYYEPYFLNHLNGKPFTLTVHDMIHEIFPQYFSNDKTTVSNKRCLISQANSIIAISENTKKDILRFFPDTANKIKTIYHGSSFQEIDNNSEKGAFILFTGLRGAYKNFVIFVQAVAPLLKKYNLRLFCSGRPFTSEEEDLLNHLQISDRTTCKLTTDNELCQLYSNALAFVFPSLYEGFGIPVLEAFSAGCPAILSNASSLPEVGGDAAVYFDPYSLDDISHKIEQVIASPSLQKLMVKKGKEQLKQFSWRKCAEETIEVYKNLLC